MRWGLIACILTLLLLSMPVHAFSGCSVMTPSGQLADADCDSTPDQFDNCPSVVNADQSDLNRNGKGDACDAIIQDIVVNPDNHIGAGESAHVTLRIINNRNQPLRGVTIRAQNSALDIDQTQDVVELPPGEATVVDFYLRTPSCAKAQRYTITFTTVFGDGMRDPATEVQRIPLTLERSDLCGKDAGALESTRITTIHELDIDRGEHVIIPITITNEGDTQATYHAAVADLGSWGSWRIDPAPSVTLPANGEGTLALFIATNENTPAGVHTVTLTVTSKDQTTSIPVRVYVRAVAGKPASWPAFLQGIILLLLLILIIIAVVTAVRHFTHKRPPRAKVQVVDLDSGAAPRSVKPTKKRKVVAVEEAEEPKLRTYY